MYDFDLRPVIVFFIIVGAICTCTFAVVKASEYLFSSKTFTEIEVVAHGGGHFDPQTAKFVWNEGCKP